MSLLRMGLRELLTSGVWRLASGAKPALPRNVLPRMVYEVRPPVGGQVD